MATIELSIVDSGIQTFLGKLIGKLTDSTPLFASIAQEFGTQTELRFQDEGPGWPQLKPATVKRRGSAHPILQITGALARSFTTDFGNDYAAVGSNSPYAPIHFFGGKIAMPARSQQAYFQQDKKSGEVGNKFVKKKKSNFAQWVTIPAYEINMPAREMLPIDAKGNLLPKVAANIMQMLQDYVIE